VELPKSLLAAKCLQLPHDCEDVDDRIIAASVTAGDSRRIFKHGSVPAYIWRQEIVMA
jgi:hypothetical protein